ncbi:MAG: NAD(P)/FAD-dependent oxidoreductase [Saprospiraceae bacterium]|nr:NAD(P)/FAD-dependent oxidoreductase [Saprospiraceae bacterium]
MAKEKKALIIGAGLVGSLWTILLAKRGYKVQVYERRSDIRQAGFAGGRSINLAMSQRGWRALEKAGIKSKIESVAIPMYGRIMHDLEGDLTFQPYGKEGQAIYSVSRGGLNLELLNIADSFDNVSLYFDERCKNVDLDKNEVRFENTKNAAQSNVLSPLIFGTDGAFSAVRNSMQKTNRFNYSQSYLDYAYKELNIPPNADGSHRMDKNALHIWPRGKFMLIALPNVDGSFTCTLFLPFENEADSFEHLQTDAQILAFFEKYFADAVLLMPDLLVDFHQNSTSSLATIRCNPWHYQHRVLLLGDAAHGIVPFFGQGMNAGFEDCTILDALMEEHGEDWINIIEIFNATRIKDANAIADLALQNFIEMRDLVADPQFLLRKQIEMYLTKKYPSQFLPVYSMVTFSQLPYSQALAEMNAQNRLFEAVFSIPNIERNWKDNPMLDQVFQNWLVQRADLIRG